MSQTINVISIRCVDFQPQKFFAVFFSLKKSNRFSVKAKVEIGRWICVRVGMKLLRDCNAQMMTMTMSLTIYDCELF